MSRGASRHLGQGWTSRISITVCNPSSLFGFTFQVASQVEATPSVPFRYIHKHEGDEHSKLLVYLFVLHHRRRVVRSGDTQFWCAEVRKWWKEHGARFGTSDASAVVPRSVSKLLAAMVKVSALSFLC